MSSIPSKTGKKFAASLFTTRGLGTSGNLKFAGNRQDMVAEKGAHAILVTSKLKKGEGHVQMFDGVVCVKPTCAIAIADILRSEILRSYSQGLSAENRELKTERLYSYITSDGFGKLLESMESNDEKLLKLDEEEQKAHKTVWNKRGLLLKSQQIWTPKFANKSTPSSNSPATNSRMNKLEITAPRVIGTQERPLGGTIRTYRRKADIDDITPNPRQPRLGPKEDEELQRQIVDNKGIFEPLLVEPHPEIEGKFRIIDGERRWAN